MYNNLYLDLIDCVYPSHDQWLVYSDVICYYSNPATL